MQRVLAVLAAAPHATGYTLFAPSCASARACSPMMGLFDGVKDAFGQGDKPIPAADRVTLFDRWLGLDKALVEEEGPDQSAAYIDPNDVNNYFSVSLPKPMGIAFVENDGDNSGVYVDEVEHSACQTFELLPHLTRRASQCDHMLTTHSPTRSCRRVPQRAAPLR